MSSSATVGGRFCAGFDTATAEKSTNVLSELVTRTTHTPEVSGVMSNVALIAVGCVATLVPSMTSIAPESSLHVARADAERKFLPRIVTTCPGLFTTDAGVIVSTIGGGALSAVTRNAFLSRPAE